ncbi:hypothetical protein N665_1343s0004 [Sinapis alba]|nr:hypothetical protein N665_1343s0004 [Sinapis alba]KAF8054149.1 hypothetical protein N665_1343s0004 [Sinapis alba]
MPPVDLDNSSTVSGGDASVSSSTGNQNPPPKKKRNLPGMPDPGAEVIALSPKTLMATNRFVCEICSKGFQRDQNLQLHRRGHNLPWKLRQRSSKEEVRKKVYVCPVAGCVHHDPARALGDLTGIKKHFCRKHGEKKYKCEKCSKKYAVQSDWKAHSKVCGTKEYRCDCCRTLFSRKDSFTTHTAFCHVLAEETNHTPQPHLLTSPPPTSPPTQPTSPSALPVRSSSESPTRIGFNVSSSGISDDHTGNNNGTPRTIGFNVSSSGLTSGDRTSNNNGNGAAAALFSSSPASPSLYASSTSLFAPSSSMEPISLCLSTNPSLFQHPPPPPHFLTPPQPAMSATALLQKAAQMGSGASLLRVSTTSSSMELSSHDLGLGLLPCSSGGSGLKELMMGNSCVFGPKQTTLDFLGLGRAVGNGGSNPGGGGLSALLTSIEGGGGGGMDVFGTAGEFAGKDIGRSS